LVTLFLVPAGQFQRHLHTLAGIAKVLRRDDFLKSITNAPDAEAMIKTIRDFSEGLR
jgi:mannitol/fructose-specific phosphotransferase system IIA component (Ntr-type)